MDIPIISKRREAARKSIEAQAITKTLTAVGQSLEEVGEGDIAKSFLTGNAAQLMSAKGSTSGKPPGSSWSNQGSTSSKLIARVTQNLSQGFNQAPEELELALAQQGLSWGPPFPPGRPLDPFYGYRTPPRTFDYSVGSNVQLTPRWNRVSFPTIKSIYEAYDVAQICVRHLINDVRSLDYNWEPIPGIKGDVSNEIEQAVEFFYSPDKRQPFRTWLAEWLQDVLRYDAGALHVRRNNGGDPIALEVVDGTTIIPLVDFYGRRPEDETGDETSEGLFQGEITPAYVQIIEGLPWDWLASSDLLYQPWNPLPDSQYGLAPLEAVLLSANTDIRFQWHFLQFFTEGTMPAGFMEAPPDMSDPAQIASWQETWDTIMMGDQTKSRQIRWVPNGAKFTAAKPDADKFSPEFVLYLARRTMAAFGVTPNDLGFTEDVNRATGDTQVDVQFRVGTSPLLRYAEDVINLFVKEHLHLRVRLRFDDGKETEDRVATATADGIYLDHGVIGIDEVRAELGRPIDKSKPSPRYINNTRVGPIPLLALESMSGEIDADTYGVADGQELVDTPYVAPPGVIPPAGTPEQKASAETTGQRANAMREATVDTGPTSEDGGPDEETEATEEPTAVEKMLALLDEIEKGVGSSAIDNTGGLGLGKGPATTIVGGTDGITVPLSIEGEDLLDDDDDEDEALKAAQTALSLRRWRDNSRNRMRKGRTPRKFVDPNLPPELHDEIWVKLSKARTREEVDRAFRKVGKAGAGKRPAFHSQADAIVSHYSPLIAAGVGKLFTVSTLKAAYTAAEGAKAKKSAAPAPPNLRAATDEKKSCGTCKMFTSDSPDGDEGLCWGYGNKRVDHSQVCDSWAAEVAKAAAARPDAQAAIEALTASKSNTAALETVFRDLYGDGILQGAYDAAVASSASIVSSLAGTVEDFPASYWDKWEPGHGPAAALVADGGMKDMLDQADLTIQGLADTSIERIGNAIADGLAKGDSYEATAKVIRDVVEDPTRADTIANTEYARAMTTAALDTYAEAGVEQKRWEAESDACPECEENAAEGDIPLDEEFANGDVPVHPNCRCAIAPVVTAANSEPTDSNE